MRNGTEGTGGKTYSEMRGENQEEDTEQKSAEQEMRYRCCCLVAVCMQSFLSSNRGHRLPFQD